MEENSNDNERLPLLGADGESSLTQEATNSKQENKNQLDNLVNLSTRNVGGRSYISCKVCGFQIDITDKTDTFVVKCLKCCEATPIKRAPAKKRYVRCSCNCLLICCETANKIVCPRQNCKKVIDLPVKKRHNDEDNLPTRLTPNSPQPSNDFNCYINCGHCQHRFSFNVLANKLATCPVCKCVSSVGHSYANTRGVLFLILFVILVTIAILLSVKSKDSSSWLILALAIILYIISIMFLFRCVYYFTLKVSEMSSNVTV